MIAESLDGRRLLVTGSTGFLGTALVDQTTEVGHGFGVKYLDIITGYLRHLKEAWDHTFAKDEAGNAMAAQDVIITVPASFDAGARELTLEAAKAAGLENIILLEEPQAALYAWLEAQGEGFRKRVAVGEVILVVDVGGGTTDFSLMTVRDREGDVELTRVAVGDHILLGGDNMDLALAHTLSQRLAAEGCSRRRASAACPCCP